MLHLCNSWIYFNFVSNAPWALLQFSWTHLSLILARRVLHDQFWARSIFLQTQPDSHRLPTLGFAADGEAGHGGNPQHATAYKGRDKPLMSWSLLINDFPAFSPGWAALSFTRQITSKGASELPGTHLCIGSPHFPALLSCPSLLLSKSHSSITCLHIKYLLEALLYRVPRLREPPVCSTVVLMMVQIHWLLGEKCMEDTVKPNEQGHDLSWRTLLWFPWNTAKWTNPQIRGTTETRDSNALGALSLHISSALFLSLSLSDRFMGFSGSPGKNMPSAEVGGGRGGGWGSLSLLFLLPWGGAAIKEHSLPFPAAWLPSVSPANVGFIWFVTLGKGIDSMWLSCIFPPFFLRSVSL